MTQHTHTETHLIAQENDQLPFIKSLLLGLQHVLAMDIYVVPFVIASILGLSLTESSILIQSTFFAAGLATIIQAYFCMKLPIAQGPSYVPIGAIVGICFASGGGWNGLSDVFGATMITSLIFVGLGFTGWIQKLISKLVPKLVGGTIIFIIGLSLLPIALDANIYAIHGSETIQDNIILAGTSIITLTICVMAGMYFKKATWLRTGSVIFALGIGSIVAYFMGRFNFEQVIQAPWFSRPHLVGLDYQVTFSGSAILTMCFVFLVLMAETTGTWFAIGSVIHKEIDEKQINRGVIGEGLGCFVSSCVASTPVTGYATNAGLISITGIASRYAFYAASAWFILFGLSAKLSTLIAIIPAPVIGGVFVMVCVIISLSGVRILKETHLSERNMFVIGIPMITTLALYLLPKDYLYSLPQVLQYILGSTIATASIVAILLNLILPEIQE